jgi:hypothetical protein
LVRFERPPWRRRGGGTDQHRHDAVALHRGIAQQQRTPQRFGQGQGNLLRPPDDLDHLLADDHAAHGDEDLLQVHAVDRADDEALEHQAQRTRHRHGHQHGRQQREQVQPQAVGRRVGAHAAQHRGRHEGAECDEHAVAKVEHVHQAEHQREARSDDEDDHAYGQAGHGEREPRRGAADGRQRSQREHRHQRHGFPVEFFERDH